jgi:alkylation response protein AidB-like acyl-CoA dehydrogenase
MDFDFSDEQEQLRDAVRKWVDKAYPFSRRRNTAATSGFEPAAWRALAELGLMGLNVPAELGGMGCGPVEAMVALEELGRGLVLEPVAQSLLCSAVLVQHGTPALQERWLPTIASGETIAVLAYQERAARYHLDRCQTTAAQQAQGYVLTGHKSVVPLGDVADVYLVPAEWNGQIAMFVVERHAQGVHTSGYPTQDGGRAAELRLEAAPAQLLSADGLAALELAVDTGIACACAEAVGVMDKTLQTTAEYLNTRKQFGVPIASFQALRHRVADMKMQLELARSMAYYANLKLQAEPSERRLALARAKVQLGQSMRFVGQQAVQLHGGVGVTDDYPVSHYFKRLTQLEMTFGDTAHHLGEVSARMQSRAGVFL